MLGMRSSIDRSPTPTFPKFEKNLGDMQMNKKPKLLLVLDILSIILLAVAAYLSLSYAPMEVTMCNVQRVFYFHVANALVCIL